MCHSMNLIIHLSHMVPKFSENAALAKYNELVISQYTCSINTEIGKSYNIENNCDINWKLSSPEQNTKTNKLY